MASSARQKSTIGRSILRLTFGTLEAASPAVGARLAHHLWFRLPPGALSSERPTGDDGPRGQSFEVPLDGRAVRGWVWGDGPLVYLVHGWSGTVDQLGPLVAPLVSKGFRVVGFDGLSHGRSDAGARGAGSSDAVELGRSLDAVAARFGPAQAVVAHSMGTLSTMLALREGWVAAARLVFVAPMAGVPDVVRHTRALLGFGDRIQSRMEVLARRRTGYDVAELDLAVLGAQVDHPALLVVHDEGDRETPHRGSVRLVAGWPGAHLHTTQGLGHRRILADPEVGSLVARFVASEPIGAVGPVGTVEVPGTGEVSGAVEPVEAAVSPVAGTDGDVRGGGAGSRHVAVGSRN